MAKATGRRKEEQAPGAASTGDFVKSLIVAIVIGIGGGGAFGYLSAFGNAAPPAKEAAELTEAKPPAPGRFPNDALEIQIPSIIVELQSEPKTKVRLDLSVIAAHGTSEASSLKNEIREDVIAFLKGLNVADIAGVRGFQNLREQLDDRARIRGRGAVLGLLIGGLVIE